jgi:hypothetical protein
MIQERQRRRPELAWFGHVCRLIFRRSKVNRVFKPLLHQCYAAGLVSLSKGTGYIILNALSPELGRRLPAAPYSKDCAYRKLVSSELIERPLRKE